MEAGRTGWAGLPVQTGAWEVAGLPGVGGAAAACAASAAAAAMAATERRRQKRCCSSTVWAWQKVLMSRGSRFTSMSVSAACSRSKEENSAQNDAVLRNYRGI